MKAILAFLAVLALVAPAVAQSGDDTSARTLAVQQKIQELNLIIQIFPLALKVEQIDPLLTELEKIRADQKKIMAKEDEELLAYEGKLDKTIDGARNDGKYPTKDAMAESYNLFQEFTVRRQLARGLFIERVYDVLKSKCDDGQLTVMEKSLNPKLIDPNFKGETREEKIRFFIRVVLLDPLSYDILKREYIRLKKGGDPAKPVG